MQDFAIKLNNIVKTYKLYDAPVDRLKESLHPFRKRYHREFSALSDVTLSIAKGECVGILGKNGSGKSTLLKIITGIIPPTQGGRLVQGRISAMLELGSGFNPEMTGIENIYLNGAIIGLSREEVTARLESVLSFADIGDFAYQPVKLYSSGMFSRLAFAVAVSVDPDILIVDEVLSVGDLRFQMKCIDKMESLKAKGTTILFVTHATEQIRRFCHRGLWFNESRLVMDDNAVFVADQYENSMQSLEATQSSAVQTTSMVCKIQNVTLSAHQLQTFDSLHVDVTYEIFDDFVPELLLGVAIYRAGRQYLFGPNTYLDKIDIPSHKGVHTVRYKIPRLTLLSKTFYIDVGLFINKGLVALDYATECCQFTVSNEYFAEGQIFIDHEWEILS
jgi:teichoic acid transport system ATP-binding protein